MAVEADILLFQRLCEGRGGRKREGGRERGREGGRQREKERETVKGEGETRRCTDFFKVILSHVSKTGKNQWCISWKCPGRKESQKTCLVGSEQGM